MWLIVSQVSEALDTETPGCFSTQPLPATLRAVSSFKGGRWILDPDTQKHLLAMSGEGQSISSEPGTGFAARRKEVRQQEGLTGCLLGEKVRLCAGHPCGHCPLFGAAESDMAEDILAVLPAGLRVWPLEGMTGRCRAG